MSVSTIIATGDRKLLACLTAAAVIAIVTATYWPVIHADFVWVDVVNFQNKGWLTQGNAWEHYIWKDFNNWTNYFRPLVIGLYTIQLRLFGVRPGPMHAVSLVIHLINTVLVGVLAWRLSASQWPERTRWLVLAIPMLLYGLHPVLIEPVAWIGCQFDLVATLFMLLGLVLNIAVRLAWVRALCVALCFFLAACSKESAAAFPLILVVFDWVALDAPRDMPMRSKITVLLRKNALTYAVTFASGVAYLALRHWALGSLTLSGEDAAPTFVRLQEASYLYLHYWRTFIWPTSGMNPLHPVTPEKFLVISAPSILKVVVALGIVLAGAVLAMKRLVIGSIVLVVTFSLLPVLHIVAANLDTSLYHERYAMTGLSLLCALCPLVLHQISNIKDISRIISLGASAVLLFWLSLSIMNIRVTLPLWSSQVALWQWAVQDHPDDMDAKAQLMAAYVGVDDRAKVWQLADEVIAEHASCTYCMLNATRIALRHADTQHAALYLDRIQNAPDLHALKLTYVAYLSERAELSRLQGNPGAAEHIARMAISLENLDPEPQLTLAYALAQQGKVTEAKEVEDSAVQLLTPAQRERQRQAFDKILATASQVSSNEQSGESGKHP